MEAVVEQGSTLLDSISAFCRASGVVESTFGLWILDESHVVSRKRA